MIPALLDGPSKDQFYLITDQLFAPATFLLHRVLHSCLRDNGQCVLVSIADSYNHWKAIATKSHIKLDTYMSNGNLLYVDALSQLLPSATSGTVSAFPRLYTCPSLFSSEKGPSMKPLFDLLRETITSGISLVIIDDLSSFEWIGVPVLDIMRFLRALKALAHENEMALVIRYRITESSNPTQLLMALIQQCSIHVEVLPLLSGHSGAVTGEIAVHAGPGTRDRIPTRSRQHAIQYKLADTGATFFEKGTSKIVL